MELEITRSLHAHATQWNHSPHWCFFVFVLVELTNETLSLIEEIESIESVMQKETQITIM